MKPYVYQQLERSRHDIRLLRLTELEKDVGRDGSINCEIKTVSLDDNPSYIALSYAWGRPESTAHLRTKDGDFGIAHNLHEALQHFREERFQSWLWVDAVCINQKDIDEKIWQVEQMRSVFEVAESVLIWLGPAAADSDLAFDRLSTCGAATEEHICIKNWQIAFWCSKFRIGNPPLVPLHPTDLTLVHVLASVRVDDTSNATIPFSPVIALLSRPWWTRIWVLQEIWVARTAVFICGRKRLLASHMAAAMTVFNLYMQAAWGNLHRAPNGEVHPYTDLRPYLMLGSRIGDALGAARNDFRSEMLTLLHATSPYLRESRRLNASDDRDRIFALLGLSWDANELGLCVDYKKTCVEVYTEVTMALARKHGLLVLSKCFFPKTLQGLPSWVIDWSAPPQGYTMVSEATGEVVEWGPGKTIIGSVPAFRACEGIDASPNHYMRIGRPSVLYLFASQVDTIEGVLDEQVLDAFRRRYDAIFSQKVRIDPRVPNHIKATYKPNLSTRSNSFSFDVTSSGEMKNVYPDHIISEDDSAMLYAGPFLTCHTSNADLVSDSVELIRKFVSAIRQMARSGEQKYGSLADFENAIWRTVTADQEARDKEKWIRPAKCHLAMQLLVGSDQKDVPIGLNSLIGNIFTKRLQDILLKSGLFSEFVVEAAQDIIYNRFPLRPHKLVAGKRLGEALHRYGALELVGIETKDDLDRLWHDNLLPQEAIRASVDDIIEKERRPDFGNEGPLIIPMACLYLYLIRLMTLGRTIFVTRSGYLCLGPMHVQRNDAVVVAHSSTVPFVLRPKPNNKRRRHEFVGECYVHGIMDGEFVANEIRRHEATFETFEIE